MLGIGFIIAHFVAMQKPQQRKYHSSCNRSVHRGTDHRKQRVKVCKRKTPHLLVRSFLSPYGDGTFSSLEDAVAARFSPPYGDGTHFPATPKRSRQFSPPYGDGTYGYCYRVCNEQVFAPLRGLYDRKGKMRQYGLVFALLRGLHPNDNA